MMQCKVVGYENLCFLAVQLFVYYQLVISLLDT